MPHVKLPKDDEEAQRREIERGLLLLRRQQAILKSRDSFMDFVKFTSPDPADPNDVTKSTYENALHHDAVAAALQEVEKGNYQFLILTMPPRHGKSQLVSRHFPAWYMGKHPDRSVVVATYNDDFAQDFGAEVRKLMASTQYKSVFPDARLVRGGQAKDRLQTTQGGMATFVGVGGSLTGRGAHALVIDDLIKDYEQARSKAFRDRAWDWFTKVAMTRRMGPKSVIITFCLTGDTPVTLANGNWKRLDAIVPGDEVLSWSYGRQVSRAVTKVSSQGEDEVFEVRTRSSAVKGNARHPFLVSRPTGLAWVRLGDLRIGDEVVVQGRRESEQAPEIDPESAWALGFFMGDGWVTINNKRNKYKDSVYHVQSFVTCLADCPAHPERVERALALCTERFGAKFKKTRFGYWRSEKADLGRWLLQFGLNAGAKRKRVPEFMFSQPAEVRRAFLDGFAGADGCVINRTGGQAHHNSRGGYVVTQILLANPDLTADVRQLARGLGIRVTNMSIGRATHCPPHSETAQVWTNCQFRYHHRTETPDAFVLEKIRSITPAGRQEVYDLTIDGTENFLADGIVVHNTRWHQDDIIGRLTDPENEYYNRTLAEKIKIIDLPAIAGEDDPLGREPGQPLWDRYDLEFLEEQRTLDPLGFEALYQQRPSLMDGDLFKRETLRFYEPSEIDERELRIYCSSDHAVDTKQRSDYTVLLRAGVDRQLNIYLLDCWWQKQQTDVVVEAMLQMFRQQPAPLVWWAERGHISKSIGPFLRRRMSESGTFGNLVEVTPAADKAQRAQSIVARAAMGKLFFPKGKPWVERAISEMMAFPNGLHDDFVDALAYIGLGLQAQIPVNSGPSTAKAPRYGTLGWWKAQQKGREPATTFGGF